MTDTHLTDDSDTAREPLPVTAGPGTAHPDVADPGVADPVPSSRPPSWTPDGAGFEAGAGPARRRRRGHRSARRRSTDRGTTVRSLGRV